MLKAIFYLQVRYNKNIEACFGRILRVESSFGMAVDCRIVFATIVSHLIQAVRIQDDNLGNRL